MAQFNVNAGGVALRVYVFVGKPYFKRVATDHATALMSQVPNGKFSSVRETENRKLSLRTAKRDSKSSEDRMFVGTISSLLGKVGSVIETGGAQVVKEAPKLEKYQIRYG
ncbi:unnamed protein product [Phytophthora lilii]|uniref:Unnamed protein product n=1 Tax=Phytophthora lilii TaxID=2077276 RepID=A0A9W6WNZ3_9STRA|nr:unnamed protein product [Phytophthora lilii]